MTTAFALSNLAVLPLWVLMIVAPRARLTGRVLASPWAVLPPIAVYAWVVLPEIATILPVVAQPELPQVAQLLGQPTGAVAAWAHFLAFDLWVGRFIVLDARERELPGVALSAVLLLTLLLAPLGLLAYLVLRTGITGRIRQLWQLAWTSSRQLSVLGVLSLLTAAAGMVLPSFDPRQLSGASVWLKPTKFGVSIAIASFTLAYLLRAIDVPQPRRRRLVTTIAWLTGLVLVIITGQAARGVRSHFNVATLLDAALFQIMGMAITFVTLAVAWLGLYAWRTRYENAALAAGVRFGIAIMVLGSCVAFLMPRPTASQLASFQQGQPTPLIGAHTVGASDDSGSGLPVTRWSSAGGDLRVPHFVGLHALQLLPLAGFALGRKLRTRPVLAARLTRILGYAYLGVTLTTLVQALRGQPLLAPDATTWWMLASVIATAVLAALVAWLRSDERARRFAPDARAVLAR